MNEAISTAEPSLSKVQQLKTTLQEKTDVLQQFQKEILELMKEVDNFAEEIELADKCQEKLQIALIDLETAVGSRSTPSPPL